MVIKLHASTKYATINKQTNFRQGKSESSDWERGRIEYQRGNQMVGYILEFAIDVGQPKI